MNKKENIQANSNAHSRHCEERSNLTNHMPATHVMVRHGCQRQATKTEQQNMWHSSPKNDLKVNTSNTFIFQSTQKQSKPLQQKLSNTSIDASFVSMTNTSKTRAKNIYLSSLKNAPKSNTSNTFIFQSIQKIRAKKLTKEKEAQPIMAPFSAVDRTNKAK